MKTLKTDAGTFGPFYSISAYPIEAPDRLRCDGIDYPFGVIGAYEIVTGSPDPVPDVPPALPPLDEVITQRRAESDALAAAKRNSVVGGTSPAEMASWPIKLAEAVKFAASSDPADAPYLGVEAAARGITLEELVAKVQTNGAMLAGLEAQIAGINGKHRDALATMTVSTDVLAYDITAGYPV